MGFVGNTVYMQNSTLTLTALSLLFASSHLFAAADKIEESCWEQTFSDDFNSLDLWNAAGNTAQWRTRYIWERDTIINNELQYYIDPIEHGMSPFSIEDGVLKTLCVRCAHVRKRILSTVW